MNSKQKKEQLKLLRTNYFIVSEIARNRLIKNNSLDIPECQAYETINLIEWIANKSEQQLVAKKLINSFSLLSLEAKTIMRKYFDIWC